MKSKWMVAPIVGALALAVYTGTTLATPPSGLSSTILAKSVFDELKLNSHTIPASDWHLNLKTEGMSDGYVVDNKLAAGGTTGWHSHPGPSFITVKSGTASFYDECDNFTPHAYAAGTGFVEDAACVHLLANEGNVDLEVVVVQIVPLGAPRRIDEPAPF